MEMSPAEVRAFALRGLARTDPFAFGEYVHGHQPAAHHREMVEFIIDCVNSGTNAVILEPRGHAKTTWGNTIFLSWLIANHKNIRIGLISNTAKQAMDFSAAIRRTFEANERFHEIYGNLVANSPKLTDVSWLRADSDMVGTKDVTCYAQGAGGAIISKRFDLILCDDIIDEENYANIEQSEKIDTWFWKTLKPCLVPGGVIIMLGTRWAENDLYEQLIRSTDEGGKGWRHLVRGALREEDGKYQALWPEVWPVKSLLAERADMGSALFACSYLNDISGLMEGNVFRKESFQYFQSLPEGRSYTVRIGVDLASSEKERADYTARVTTAEDQQGNFYILSVVRDKRATGHAEFVQDGWAAYPHVDLVLIENQQFQSTLIQEIMRDYPYIPVEGKRSDADKTTRARAVAAKYEARKIFHHEGLRGSDFEMELLSFPKGHDDMVDAMGFSMDLGGNQFVFGSVRR
jgi:predicted phage terminase large subunit-like protein